MEKIRRDKGLEAIADIIPDTIRPTVEAGVKSGALSAGTTPKEVALIARISASQNLPSGLLEYEKSTDTSSS